MLQGKRTVLITNSCRAVTEMSLLIRHICLSLDLEGYFLPIILEPPKTAYNTN
jgi:hypothetical protein